MAVLVAFVLGSIVILVAVGILFAGKENLLGFVIPNIELNFWS